MALPEPLITQRDIAPGAITFQSGFGRAPTGKARERRIYCTFPTANVPVPFAHGLGRKPVTFVPAIPYSAATVYADRPLVCDTRTIVLKCDTAGATIEVIVR